MIGLPPSCKLTPMLVGAAAATAFFAAVTFAPQQANATPQFAAQTKLPCGQCHVSAAGGGALKPFGQKFKNNGNKLK